MERIRKLPRPIRLSLFLGFGAGCGAVIGVLLSLMQYMASLLSNKGHPDFIVFPVVFSVIGLVVYALEYSMKKDMED